MVGTVTPRDSPYIMKSLKNLRSNGFYGIRWRMIQYGAPMKFFHLPVISVGLIGLLTACSSPEIPARAIVAQSAPAQAPSPVGIDETSFQNWLLELRQEALKKGVSEKTVTAALGDVTPIPRVIELDRRQPEFTQTFWRYLDGAVSEARVRDGVARLAENREILNALEAKYGIPGRFLVAFWGLETNYGRNLGAYPVVSALATLAFDGRRSTFFRSELFDALKIIDQSNITPDKMIGSWAGAMGQTQFMPSTFLRHAVDETGDGRIDVWGQTDDALGSGANYLKNLGWVAANTWGREVLLPQNFDYTLVSLDSGAKDVLKPLNAWAALGITRVDGKPLPSQNLAAALVLPSGASGPAFLVYDNFRAILKWNRSISYALAIGHLSDRIVGAPKLTAVRSNDAPLSRESVIALQAALKQQGFLAAAPDGVLGSGTRQALRQYQMKCGYPADGFASPDMVRAVITNSISSDACKAWNQG